MSKCYNLKNDAYTSNLFYNITILGRIFAFYCKIFKIFFKVPLQPLLVATFRSVLEI